MKKIMMIAAGIALCVAPQMVEAHPHHAKSRVVTNARINKGARTGQLTVRETRTLKRQQARVTSMKVVARADGFVTPRERVVINRAQTKLNRNIYVKKHNSRVRGW